MAAAKSCEPASAAPGTKACTETRPGKVNVSCDVLKSTEVMSKVGLRMTASMNSLAHLTLVIKGTAKSTAIRRDVYPLEM